MWHGNKEVEYPLAEGWQVTVNNIPGHNMPAMKSDEIKSAISSPIGMQPLKELAKGKNEVVIIFDDMTRNTRAYEIIPHVLEELKEAGIPDNKVRFIAAVANHHAMDRSEMVKKLGEDVVARYHVFNHCSFFKCSYIGTTSYGTKAEINDEVLRCDMKIAIGSIMPHPQYGMSGGAKLIFPGVAGYDSVKAHHQVTHEAWKTEQREKGIQLRGFVEGSPINADAREVVAMVGIDMLINCLPNRLGETVGIFAGAFEPTYQAAVEEARKHFLVENTRDNDIVIANTFIKVSEYYMGMAALPAVNPKGGSFVVLASSPTGQVIHYLFDKFGKPVGEGDVHGPGIPLHIKNFIIYSEFPEAKMADRFAGQEKGLMTSDWNEVIERLKKSHGAGSKVTVYPNADTQYFAP